MRKVAAETKGSGEQTPPSSIVKCDVCGQRFNRSYLSSHKRLSHGKRDNSALSIDADTKAVETILTLYLQMSTTARKNLLERLASMPEPSSD